MQVSPGVRSLRSLARSLELTFFARFSIAVPVPTTTITKPSERKQDIGKEAAIEAEVRAARERALVPLETRVVSFKEMLKEKDVRRSQAIFEPEIHSRTKCHLHFAGICIQHVGKGIA